MYFQTFLQNDRVRICTNVIFAQKDYPVAVIIFPGLNLSKSGPFFLLSNVARRCAEVGISVFQFDYYGDGDSSGSYETMDLERLNQSVALVKEFAQRCGYEKFIYVGYGLGNILMLLHSSASDVIALCMIAPELEANRDIDLVLEKTKAYGKEYFYQEGYLWPNTVEKPLQAYWSSIIGIVDWLYYTPFSIDLLREIAEIDVESMVNVRSESIYMLLPEGSASEKYQDFNTVTIEHLYYHTRQEWNTLAEWPDLWARMAELIKNWVSRVVSTTLPKGGTNRLTSGRPAQDQPAPSQFMPDRLLGHLPQLCCQDGINCEVEAVSFVSDSKQLFGILHWPSGKRADRRYPCVIYEPGLGGSRVDMGRAGPWVGRELARRGYLFLRYDSAGSGVSEGEFYEVTWEKRYRNLMSAIAYLESHSCADTSYVVLLTYSAGAKVACMAAAANTNIKACVFWSPHFIEEEPSGHRSSFLLREQRLVMPMSGLWLGFDFVREDRSSHFLEQFKALRTKSLVITGSASGDDINIEPVVSACDGVIKKVIQYPGAHCFQYQYMEAIINDTVRYIVN